MTGCHFERKYSFIFSLSYDLAKSSAGRNLQHKYNLCGIEIADARNEKWSKNLDTEAFHTYVIQSHSDDKKGLKGLSVPSS